MNAVQAEYCLPLYLVQTLPLQFRILKSTWMILDIPEIGTTRVQLFRTIPTLNLNDEVWPCCKWPRRRAARPPPI